MSRLVLARGAVLLAAFASVSCVSVSYEPRITLGVSPETLPVRVQVRELRDVSPPEDKERYLGGVSATARDSLSGKLETAVTDALIVSLRSDAVFTEARRRPEQPDLVLSGSIRRMYGRAYVPPLGYAAVFLLVPALLGVPVYVSQAGVDLEIVFERTSGEPVALYTATREYQERFSLYRNPMLGVGSRLNELLAAAVADVRAQILADRSKLVNGSQIVSPRRLE